MNYNFIVSSILCALIYTQTNAQINTFVTRKYYSSSQDAQIGNIALKNSRINLKPHGSYIEVTEEAIISSILTNYNGTNLLSFQGYLRVPQKSTIISLFFAHDSGEFVGKVHPTYKQSFPIDSTSGSVLASLNWMSNPNFLDDTGSNFDYYYLKIFDISPSKEYTIKIHYLIPNSGNATQGYPVEVLFNSTMKNPGVIELSFSSDTTERQFTLNVNNINLQLDNSQSLQIPYTNKLEVFTTDNIETSIHTTTIDSGDWSGKYLLLNTKVPDSVISKMSKPVELVVLWRWNRPNSFVTRYYNSTFKSLSNYGFQAKSQAEAIRQLINDISTTGNKTGLVHSIQYRQPEVFPLCKKNSSGFAKLDNYLNQFTEDYFLNSGYFEYDTKPDNPDDTIPGPTDSSKVEFLKSISIVHGLYSNGSGVLKHLVIVSCGPVQISRNLITLEEIDTLLSSISVDCSTPVWRDVNFSLVKVASQQKPLYPYGKFNLPEFKPASMILHLSNKVKDYSFPLATEQSSFSVIAKSDSLWDEQLTWSGYDATGKLIGTVQTSPFIYNCNSDTGLVKLWAANNERLSEIDEKNVSLKYGVVSELTSLKILPTYKGYDSTATAYAQISKYFVYDSTTSTKLCNNGFSDYLFRFYKNRNVVRFSFPGNEKIVKIQVYLLSGKLLGEFPVEQFRTHDGYIIPISFLTGGIKASMVIVRIFGENKIFNRKIVF